MESKNACIATQEGVGLTTSPLTPQPPSKNHPPALKPPSLTARCLDAFYLNETLLIFTSPPPRESPTGSVKFQAGCSYMLQG